MLWEQEQKKDEELGQTGFQVMTGVNSIIKSMTKHNIPMKEVYTLSIK